MTQFTEVYEGQFNLTSTGVDNILQGLDGIDKAAKRVAESLGKIKVPAIKPAVDATKLGAVVQEAEKVNTKVKTSFAATGAAVGKSYQEMTEIVRSQIARLPDKTAPEFFRLTDQFNKVRKEALKASDFEVGFGALEQLKRLSAELERVGVVQAKVKSETRQAQKDARGAAASEEVKNELARAQKEFVNVNRMSNFVGVGIGDRLSGLKLAVSGTGSSLQGLREVLSGANDSSNLFVKGLDAIIARRDPMLGFSNSMGKALAEVASNTSRAFQSLQMQQTNLKQSFTKEVGTGSAVFEKFNEQLTKTNAAIKQVQVTALAGGDVSTALIRARVEAQNLTNAYRLVAIDGAIPAGTQTKAMFDAMGQQIKSAETRLTAMGGRYEMVKKKAEDTKASQEKQAASTDKQKSAFDRVTTSIHNTTTALMGGRKAVDDTKQSYAQLDTQLQKTSTFMDVLKGSFLGTLGGNLLSSALGNLRNLTSSLGSEFYSLNNTIQNMKITITGMLEGSGVAAEAAIKGFTEFVEKQVASTPFEYGDAIDAALRLVQQGFNPQDWFRPAANAAAAMNKPMEQFIGAMTKLAAGSKGIAIDMFRDFGLNVNNISGLFDKVTGKALTYKEMQATLGMSADEVAAKYDKMSFAFDKQGSLSLGTADAFKVLNAYLTQNATFAKAAEARSLSLDGVISNLKDNVGKILISFGQPLFEKLTIGATGLLEKLNTLSPAIQAFAALLGTNLAGAIDTISNIFTTGFIPKLDLGGNAISNFITAAVSLAQGDFTTAWNSVYTTISGVLDSISTYLDDFSTDAYDWGVSFINQIADGIYEAAGAILDAVAEIGSAIASYLMPGSPPEKGPLSTIDEWGKDVMGVWMNGVSKVDVSPLKNALTNVKNVFGQFDLGSAQADVLNIQEQIRKAEEGGFVPAELKKQLQLAQDKVALLQQQEQLQSQIDKQAETTPKGKQTSRGAGGGGGGGGGGRERVGVEKKTNLQIRDDALAILDKQLADGIIKHEDYVKEKLKIYEKFYQDESELGEDANQEQVNASVSQIKDLQAEVERIEEAKKKKKGDDTKTPFKPPSVAEIFQGFADSVTSTVENVGTKAGTEFVNSVKKATVKQLDTVKEDVAKKFEEVSGKASESVGKLFDKIKTNFKPIYIPIIAAIVGGLVYLASGPIIAGLAAVGGAIASVVAAIGGLVVALPLFLAIGLAVTAVVMNWDKITTTAGQAIEYLTGVVNEFIAASGGIEAVKNNLNAAWNVITTQSYEFATKLMNGVKKIIQDFNFQGALYSVKKAFTDLDLSAFKNTLANLFDPLVAVVQPKIEAIKEFFYGLIPPALILQVTQLKDQFVAMFSEGRLGGELLDLFAQLGELFVALIPVAKAVGIVIAVAAGLIANVFVSAFQGLADAMPFVIGLITGLTTTVTGLIDIFTGLINYMTGAWAYLTGDTETANQRFQAAMQNMSDGVYNIFMGLYQSIVNFGAGFVVWSASFVLSFVNNILGFIPGMEKANLAISAFKDVMVNSFTQLLQQATFILYGLANQIKFLLPYALDYITKVAIEFVNDFVSYITELYGKIVDGGLLTTLVDNILLLFDKLATDGEAKILEFLNGIVTTISGFKDDFINIGSDIVAGLLEGINANKDKVLEVLKGLITDQVSSIRSWLGMESPSKVYASIGSDMMAGLNKGLASNPPTVKDIIEDAQDEGERQLKRTFARSKVKSLMQQYKAFVTANYAQVTKIIDTQGSKAAAQFVYNALGTMDDITQGGSVRGLLGGVEAFMRDLQRAKFAQPLEYAQEQQKVLQDVSKTAGEVLTQFNQDMFNVRNSTTEARIELERLFNQTITDDEVSRMAKAFEGTPVDQLDAQQRLIYQNYVYQQKLADATEEEAKVRQQMEGFSSIQDAVEEIGKAIEMVSPKNKAAAEEAGSSISEGLGLGIDAGASDVLARIANMAAGIVTKVEQSLGIHSPSTVFRSFGENLMLGLAQGITGAQAQVATALSAVNGVVSSGLDLNPLTLQPALDTRGLGGSFDMSVPQAGTAPMVNIVMNNTINDEFDEATFNARVKQSIIQAIRTGK